MTLVINTVITLCDSDFLFPALLWLIKLCKQKKLKANYLLYSQCSTVQEWLMIDQWLAVKATKFIIKKSTSCHWIQRMICVNLGFFSEKRLYVVNILSSGYEIIRIYTGKSLHFMCCSRVQWTEFIMSIIFILWILPTRVHIIFFSIASQEIYFEDNTCFMSSMF